MKKHECMAEELIPHAVHAVLAATTIALASVILHKVCRIHHAMKEIHKGHEEVREGRRELFGLGRKHDKDKDKKD